MKDKPKVEELPEVEPMSFAEYQMRVMHITTPVWPVEDPSKALEQIMWRARAALGTNDKHVVIINTAAILRHVAELCDYMPVSLERVAQLSLRPLPGYDGPSVDTTEARIVD